MATTLTKSVSSIGGSGTYTYRCVVTENSRNTANNTSNITIEFSIKGPWAPSFYEWSINCGILIDGDEKTSKTWAPYVSTSYVTILTWTGDVLHNSDGSKKINVGVYLNASNPASYLPTQYKQTSYLQMGSVSLTSIPRTSSITSINNVVLGNKIQVKFTPSSTSFYYNIKFSIGNWSVSSGLFNPNKTSEYTYVYTPSESDLTKIYATMPSSVSGTMTATLTTYTNNNTNNAMGSTSKTFTVTIPDNIKPTISASDIGYSFTSYTFNGASTNTYLIKGKNKITVNIKGCEPGSGSGIASYSFKGQNLSQSDIAIGLSGSYDASATSDVLTAAGTFKYTVTVKDKRGRTASATMSTGVTCHDYSAPTFTSFDVYRCNEDGTRNNSGVYMKCTYNINYSSIDSNKCTIKIYYKKSSDSSYTVSTTSGVTANGSKTFSSIASDSSYVVYAQITDLYNGSTKSTSKTISSAFRVVNVTKNGTGIAFGQMAESNNTLESKYKIRSHGNITCRENSTGFYLTKSDGTSEIALYRNNKDNLWIGARFDNTDNITGGGTYISTGDNSALYVCKQNGDTRSTYKVLDGQNYASILPDCVIEQGTSNSWRYRKWNSGVAEAWYYKSLGTLSLTTEQVSGVYSNSTYKGVTLDLPEGLFSSSPTATCNVCSTGYTNAQIAGTTTTSVTYRIWASYSCSPNSCAISIHLIGKWK